MNEWLEVLVVIVQLRVLRERHFGGTHLPEFQRQVTAMDEKLFQVNLILYSHIQMIRDGQL
jgi:hypothetical protein